MYHDPLQATLRPAVQDAFKSLFGADIPADRIAFQATRPEFEGDATINVFPFLKQSGKGPEQTAQAVGEHLQAHVAEVERFNVIKGFLNLVIADSYWLGFLEQASSADILAFPDAGRSTMVEYSSPNTNKPLHLGHLRNNFLGHSVSRILEAAGHRVVKVQVINDRGIHICKSMLAWQRFGNGETPGSSGLKGDKLVGKYYVKFDQQLKKGREAAKAFSLLLLADSADDQMIGREELMEIALQGIYIVHAYYAKQDGRVEEFPPYVEEELIQRGAAICERSLERMKKALSLTFDSSPDHQQLTTLSSKRIMLAMLSDALEPWQPTLLAAQEMLRQWEAGDPEVVALWKTMNGWVYDGFNATYARMGVDFDRLYYESDTYKLGRDEVLKGLEQGVFFRKDDGSVWCDLTSDGLDEKLLLRSDGTAVYMTQDIGTAIQRFREFPDLTGMVYTVGNEQDYHFKVLFLVLKKLGYAWADELFHLSYGMVDLPSGKMKSREGTVVDADDLINVVVEEARKAGEELSKLDGFSEAEKAQLFEQIGLAALKYFLLKVDPKKRMLFDPAASIDLQGHTGPFIQYTYARIRSLLRKAEEQGAKPGVGGELALGAGEREVIKLLHHLPTVLQEAADRYDPSSLANHAYELVKAYNTFYQGTPVLKEEDAAVRDMRLALSHAVAEATKKALWCLGIEVPERM